ncbi:MAG TPA: copper chaperone PCu(A)C [Streptosporangiaceae bacterium]|nr:copper chaperone PCu(A)C [Streptosporangiaceae bacterium]
MTGSRTLSAVVRPVAVPVACAALLTGLLSAWVATGGGGTLRRLPFRFELAAISSPPAGTPGQGATTYLVIKNLAGPDELLSARATMPGRLVLARRGTDFRGTDLRGTGPPGAGSLPALAVPGGGTTSLSPLGPDIVLIDPGELQIGATVPVTLTFRHAGRITVDFTVTPPGTP